VHQASLAAAAAQQLAGAIGEHFVDVHVRLRATAGLPDRERELGIALAAQHLVGCLRDRAGLLLRQLTQLGIDERGRLLDQRERVQELARHLLVRDAKVLPAALGLRAPQPLGWNLDGPKRVVLGAGRHAVDAKPSPPA
jgi:hypothetical protein